MPALRPSLQPAACRARGRMDRVGLAGPPGGLEARDPAQRRGRGERGLVVLLAVDGRAAVLLAWASRLSRNQARRADCNPLASGADCNPLYVRTPLAADYLCLQRRPGVAPGPPLAGARARLRSRRPLDRPGPGDVP